MGHAQGIRHWYEFENFWLQPHLPGASGLTTENAWRLNNISQARSYAPSNVRITHRKFKDYPTIQIIQYVPYSVVAYKVSQIVRKHYMSFKNYPDSEVHVIQKQERKQHFVFITNKNNWGKKKVTNYLKKHSWSYEIWSHNPSGSGIVVTWTGHAWSVQLIYNAPGRTPPGLPVVSAPVQTRSLGVGLGCRGVTQSPKSNMVHGKKVTGKKVTGKKVTVSGRKKSNRKKVTGKKATVDKWGKITGEKVIVGK